MSDNGKDIIGNLPLSSPIQNPNNPMYKIIDNTVGEWLDNFDLTELFHNFFLQNATEGYLDLIGLDFNVHRKPNESDEDFRKRIVYERLGHLTIDYLKDVYCLDLYSYVEDFNPRNNTLISDNPLLHTNKLMMADASFEIKNILNEKFVLNGDVVWI